MLRDVRTTDEFRAVEAFYTALFSPGGDHAFSAKTIAADRDGTALFLEAVGFRGRLEEGPSSRIVRLVDGRLVAISQGAGRLPRLSPDGRSLAYVAPAARGDALNLCGPDGSGASAIAPEGHIEEIAWSPDGRRILLVVAGLGADLSGHEGGFALATASQGPSWLPEVETGMEADLWRRLWLYDLESGRLAVVSPSGTNVWEASWCGADHIAVIRSGNHDEGSWYRSTLVLIGLDGSEREVYAPAGQIGLPTGSPDGRHIAFVEAFCSDRGIVCGTLKLATTDGTVRTLATNDAEVTGIAWRDDANVHYAGHRAFETIAGDHRIGDGAVREVWATETLTAGEWYPSSVPVGEDACLVIAEAYGAPPHLLRVSPGRAETLHAFASPGGARLARECGAIEPVRWNAPDGLEIHGWLVKPEHAKPPYRLMIDIHGGPVWANRNRWMGRLRATALLVRLGYAVLYPNPRGSSTRGQEFARHVGGDMGGADTHDFLSACDALVERGLVDPKAIALTGTSYGGFMSSWLVTQDQRFAAAVPISPVSNWYSQHRTSQIPYFDELFLNASAYEPDNKFFRRSPAMFANRVKTPSLVMAGARDKNTPPGQALEFYRSLLENGVETALVTYPEDGHSLRGYPAFLDTAARILLWLKAHVPAP